MTRFHSEAMAVQLVAKATPTSFQPDEFERLMQEHAEIGKRYAALWSEYGPGSTLDNKRKAFVETLAVKIRMTAEKENTKVTEAFITQRAHADESYSEWLQAEDYGRLSFQLTALELERVQHRLDFLEITAKRGL